MRLVRVANVVLSGLRLVRKRDVGGNRPGSARPVAADRVNPAVLAVELHDQGFLDGGVDLGALRPLEHLPGEAVVVGLQPGSDDCGEIGRLANGRLDRGPRPERHDLTWPYLVRGDVHALPVDEEVPMRDELRGPAPCVEAKPSR